MVCASPPFTLLRNVLLRVMLSTGLSMILVGPLWPQKDWFADLMALLVEPHIRKFHRPVDASTSCMEVVKWLV